MLLCKLGHKPALLQIAAIITEMQDVHPELEASVGSFLANHAASLTSELIQLLQSPSPLLVLFAAPWCIKYDPQLTCKQLHDISCDSKIEEPIRNRAFGLLSRYDPSRALEDLASGNARLGADTVLKAIECAYSDDEYEPEQELLAKIFAKGLGDIPIAAAIFLSEEGHKAAKDLLRTWLIARYDEKRRGVVEHSAALMFKGAVALTRSGDQEWISFLSSYGPPESYPCRQIWRAAKHPIGLATYLKKLDEITDVDKMFSPMVGALRWYGADAGAVVQRVLATGDERLKKRAAELAAGIWPGKSLEEIAEENSPIPTSEAEVPIRRDDVSPARRRERIAILLERDPRIPKSVKEMEDYTCQVCGRRLFQAKTNTPYAETHHVQPLGHDGPDSPENVLCLCPLCHRLFHLGAIGVDESLRLHLAPGYNESLLAGLQVRRGRRISPNMLMYHWMTFFVAPVGVNFSEDEDSCDEECGDV